MDKKRERRKRRSELRNKYRPLIVRVQREIKRRTLARFIKKKYLKPKMDWLYLQNVLYRNVKPISDFIYNNCEFIIYSQSQWEEKQETLKKVCVPIIKACKNKQKQNYNADIPWQARSRSNLFFQNVSWRCAIPHDSPKFFKISRIEIENYPIIIRMGLY
jgi:hypothetical protein